MKKKAFWLLLVAMVIMGFSINVYAKDNVYYTTNNGIELTEEEYKFLTKFYGTPYVDIMTRDQYNEFVEDDLLHSDLRIKKVTPQTTALVNPGNMQRGTYNYEAGRTIQIGAACLPTKCIMSLLTTWDIDPAITSWDDIGAWLDTTTLKSYSHTYLSTSNTTSYFTNWKVESDGIGNTVFLPEDGTNMIINMAFTVSRGGTVYGSYQHAMEDTTFSASQSYTLDFAGYANVHLFSGAAIGVYDEVGGVDINV